MGTRLEHWRPELVGLFEAVRAHVCQPIQIASGWRCPRHNEDVSVVDKSQHSIGAALDISCPALGYCIFAHSVEYAARLATKGQAGIGKYPRLKFVHVDLGLGVRPGRRWGSCT